MNKYKMKARAYILLIGGFVGLFFDGASGTMGSSYIAKLYHDKDVKEAEASFGEFILVTELVTKVRK